MGEMVRAGTVDEIKAAGHKVVPVGDAPVLVMFHAGEFHAVDNRCPHMGFPLHQGDIHDGRLDCHWHHARFDITSGATLDPWADDVDCYRVHVDGGAVFVDPSRPSCDPRAHGLERLGRGLDENIRLVVAKSAIELEGGRRAGVRRTRRRRALRRQRARARLAEEHGPRAALDGVLACCTDHRYGDGGHTLDFAVKCAELAELLSEDADAALMFTALVPQLVSMARLEETSAWRRPVDLAALVADAAGELPAAPFEEVGAALPLADEEGVR